MASNDYICIYRQFFEEFAKTFQKEECGPMRVNLYNLTIEELVGEVMHSCVNFFTERKCPRGLIVPLTKIVVEEFLNEAKKQPEEVNTPLKLNRKTHNKIYEVCLRFTDNEKLSNLPRPVLETYYSTHSTKHTRRRMEDRLICLPRFNALHSIQSNSEAGYYGIFDGHNGVNAACYAVSHLHQFLAESEFYPDDPVQAFRQAFEKTESKYNSKDENSGTTALAILHQPGDKKLIVGWVGDSQAMLSCEDSYVMLVDPHKPERKDERRRIEDLGGFIIKAQGAYRVNGGLAISRAIGDKKLKPHVSAEPEIRVLKLTGSEHFIVMGCDGLWDVVEPQQVIETVYFEVRNSGGQIDTVGRRLVDLAKENNSADNISVIVIFLTDPAEISNRSINVSGHRPKILLQDGVIMETNFQGSEKSPLSEPGMNGIYGANGNHLGDHVKNESDEDFGPETDVDAVDDVLTSPNNLNPFANECWQKSQTSEEVSDKLIEFSRQETADLKEEIMKFSDEFAESFKTPDNKQAHESVKSDIKLDSFSVNSMNPFEASVVSNTSDVSKTSNFGTDDDNKLVEDTDSKKGEVDNFMISNYVDDESFDSKNLVGLIRDPDQTETNNTLRGSENGQAVRAKENLTDSVYNVNNLFTTEGKGLLDGPENPIAAEPVQKDSISKTKDEFCAEAFLSSSETGPEHVAITTETNDVRDLTFPAKEPAENLVFGAIENAEELGPSRASPEPEQQVSSDFVPTKENTFTKEEAVTSTLFSPSAPPLHGEAKDEVVAESGGEVEDSEDDEWNYIEVKSGCEVPIGNDSVPTKPSESSEAGKSMINSPLNPNAAEFVPVGSVPTAKDFKSNETPKKAASRDLTDIVASSPNWVDMQNVSLPDESVFLDDIKSKPSNVLDDIDLSQHTGDVNGKKVVDISADINFTSTEGPENTKELETDLTSGMTCSFVGSKTTPQSESLKEQLGLSDLSSKESVTEKKDLFFSESASSKLPELGQTESEMSPELPNLLSPISGQGNLSRDTSELTEAEAHISSEPEPFMCEPPQDLTPVANEVEAADPNSLNREPAPLVFEEPASTPKILAETCEKLPFDDKPNGTLKAAAGTVSVNGATAMVAKKDVKTASPKTAGIKVNKTSTTAKLSSVNGTKSSSPTKKLATTNQPVRTSKTTKTITATTTALATGSKTAAPKVPSVSKTVPKPSSPSTFTLNKIPARQKPAAAATPPNSKAGTFPKSTVTACATKSDQNMTKTSASATAPKPKPRVPSGLPDKKAASVAPSGDVKTSIRRTEASSKKPDSTATRVLVSARPATAPAKSTSFKTTVTTTRTVTAKPRTIVSNITSTSAVFSATRASSTARKTAPGSDKQAKELANRITSKASTVTKANGVAHGKTTTTVTKTRKTPTSTITMTPSKTKNENKTEPKADETRDQVVKIVQSEKNDNNNDDNLISSIASD